MGRKDGLFKGRNSTNQYAYAENVPRPAAVVRSSQRRFLSFPVMGAIGIVAVVGGWTVDVGSRVQFWNRTLRKNTKGLFVFSAQSALLYRLISSHIVLKCKGTRAQVGTLVGTLATQSPDPLTTRFLQEDPPRVILPSLRTLVTCSCSCRRCGLVAWSPGRPLV